MTQQNNPPHTTQRVAIWSPWELYHYHFYSRRVLTDLLEECGLEVLGVTSSHVLFSSRRNAIVGRLFERVGDLAPTLGAHLIVFAEKSR